MSTFFQTTMLVEVHLAKGQFVLEEGTWNVDKSLIYLAGTQRPAVSKTEGKNLNNNNNNSI
jgi:hypothetical protein